MQGTLTLHRRQPRKANPLQGWELRVRMAFQPFRRPVSWVRPVKLPKPHFRPKPPIRLLSHRLRSLFHWEVRLPTLPKMEMPAAIRLVGVGGTARHVEKANRMKATRRRCLRRAAAGNWLGILPKRSLHP